MRYKVKGSRLKAQGKRSTRVNYPVLKGEACESKPELTSPSPPNREVKRGYVTHRFKTHLGMLPQSQALKVPIADKRKGKHETDGDIMPVRNMGEGSEAERLPSLGPLRG